ncbi:hypothetical protein KUCAC02_005478, partial [Chaenocephalus aceratus]
DGGIKEQHKNNTHTLRREWEREKERSGQLVLSSDNISYLIHCIPHPLGSIVHSCTIPPPPCTEEECEE